MEIIKTLIWAARSWFDFNILLPTIIVIYQLTGVYDFRDKNV